MLKDPRQMRVAYVSSVDPRNRLAWSGSHYSIFSALQKNFAAVDVLGPYEPSTAIFFGKAKHFLAKMFGKRYDFRRSRAVSEGYAKYFDERLAEGNYDLIVAPAASAEVARLKTKVPIVYISDATLKASLNYHKAITDLTATSLRESMETERKALEKSALLMFTTPWAANSAIEGFGIDQKKVVVAPFGANFDEEPSQSKEYPKEKGPVCKLLFIGVNWENKGGPIAINTLRKLRAMGVDAELTVCGCVPPAEFKDENVTVIPFLNKSVRAEREKLYSLYKEASFFILPTRFEAYGLVFCEASAYGVPSLATRTGGVPGVITEGENGFLFEPADSGEGYAGKIFELWKDEKQYHRLVSTSREKYENQLNWAAFGNTLIAALEERNVI
jgi:glycosyltransferase involved in cell wall biosynthesis